MGPVAAGGPTTGACVGPAVTTGPSIVARGGSHLRGSCCHCGSCCVGSHYCRSPCCHPEGSHHHDLVGCHCGSHRCRLHGSHCHHDSCHHHHPGGSCCHCVSHRCHQLSSPAGSPRQGDTGTGPGRAAPSWCHAMSLEHELQTFGDTLMPPGCPQSSGVTSATSVSCHPKAPSQP